MRLETIRGRWTAGEWRYARARPAALAGWVDHLWAYRGPTANRLKRVFPNGCVELIVNFAAPYRIVGGAADATLLRDATVSGLGDTPLVVEQPPFQDCMAARLRPAGARALLGRPMVEVVGRNVLLSDLVGSSADELREACAEAGTEERLRRFERWLLDRIRRPAAESHPTNDAVAWMIEQLAASHGAVSVERLREETGFSKRRVLSAFRDRVGLTPKRYARVLRFHRALGLLQRAPSSIRLVEVAHEARFYDQAHMNTEFRALGGVTPSAFLRARHPVGDGSTAADG